MFALKHGKANGGAGERCQLILEHSDLAAGGKASNSPHESRQAAFDVDFGGILAECFGVKMREDQAWFCPPRQAYVYVFAGGGIRDSAGFNAKPDIALSTFPRAN